VAPSGISDVGRLSALGSIDREGLDVSLVLADLVVGTALWAVRHEVPITVPVEGC